MQLQESATGNYKIMNIFVLMSHGTRVPQMCRCTKLFYYKIIKFIYWNFIIDFSILFFTAGGNPDDDAEVIGNQPGIQFGPTPSIPSFPSIPTFPVVPSIPSIPSIPVYPSQGYPGYPTYPTTVSYVPFGWGYNIFDSFSSKFQSFVQT